MKSDAVRHLELKVLALAHYGGIICRCGEARLDCMTLSHLAAFRGFNMSGHNLYAKLKSEGYPPLPLLSECISCNVARDSWGRQHAVRKATLKEK